MALYIREYFGVVKLEAGSNKVESLWVRIGGKANKADILVGSVIGHQTRMGHSSRSKS